MSSQHLKWCQIMFTETKNHRISRVARIHKDHVDSLSKPGCINLGTALIFRLDFQKPADANL